MICNECATTKCKAHPVKDRDTGRFMCSKHVPVKGGWSLLEIAMATSPQATHDLCQRAGIKFKKGKL